MSLQGPKKTLIILIGVGIAAATAIALAAPEAAKPPAKKIEKAPAAPATPSRAPEAESGMTPEQKADRGMTPEQKAEEEARKALPVAKIDSYTITVGEFEAAVERQSPLLRKDMADPKKRLEFVEKLINLEVMAAEAERRGFAKDEEVVSVRKNQLASLMHRKISDSIPDEEPSEEAMKAYYDAHAENYHKPEKVRARAILVTDKAKAEKLLADVLAKKPSQHEFRRLAQENSEDESTRLRGGDLTFFTKPNERQEGDPEVDPAVVEAAFKIKENGEIYPALVKGEKGYYVIMRTGHRDRMDVTFEEAKPRLAVLVKRETRKANVEKAIEELKDRFKVEISEENLKDVVIDLSGGPPEPDAPGGLTAKEREERKKFLFSGRDEPGKAPTAERAEKKK